MSIQSVQRAFDILKAIDNATEPTPATKIAKTINLPRTTVIRMLTTLEEIGAVQRVENGKSYQIGSVVRLLGQPKTTERKLKKIARPELQQLAQTTGETVYLCVPVGQQVYYLDQIDSRHHILLRNWAGCYFPAHTTAAGKVFLAHLGVEELELYLKRPLESYTDKTITNPTDIRAYAQQIPRDGFAWTHAQTEEGLVGVAAPIFDGQGKVVAAVSLGGPAFRFPKQNQADLAAQTVVQTAHRIQAKLL